MIENLTNDNFAEKTAQGLTFTDFWATWCGPCRMQGPVVEQLSEELDGKVSFFKVDVDENQATAEKFGVMSIPTMIIQKDGKVVYSRWISRERCCEENHRKVPLIRKNDDLKSFPV